MKLMKKFFKYFYDRWCHYVDPVGYARKRGVRVGENCRLISADFGSEPYLVTLGDHVSITASEFITHDGGVWVFREKYPECDLFGRICVGNNVFIGYGCIIMPGVTIGDNVVIGAGAIVTRDIPSNCVAVGAPARRIKNIDEYWKGIESRIVPTQLLGPVAKREYLLKYFRLTSQSASSGDGAMQG
jgi:acetyltransferase-like isoleucine patch superfamily enzyme